MKIQCTAYRKAIAFVIAIALSFICSGMTASASGDSYSSLKSDIASAVSPSTIDISGNFSFDGTIEIKEEQDITIIGGGFTLTSQNTRHFKVYGKLTLVNVTLNGGGSGGGVYVGDGGTLIVENSTIKNCQASGGGAIYADTGASVELSDKTTISGNKAVESGGGAIYAGAGASIELTGSRITDNKTEGKNGAGGGIILHPGAGLVMKGGSIDSNTASGDGGGVYAVRNNTVELTDGAKITGNTTGGSGDNYHGAGIHINDDGNLVLNGAEVTENTGAYNGGGVSLYKSNITIDGGEVSGNKAAYGGGVYVALNSSAATYNGSSITGNSATNDGGGIFTEKAAYLDSSYAYDNLSIADDTEFFGNSAAKLYPHSGNHYLHIKSASVSAGDYVLNNYDINSLVRTVIFVSNGGTDIERQYVEYGRIATQPTAPTRSGYTFSGWYSDDSTFINIYDFSTAVTEDITLYAKWAAKTYTVTFVSNGGSSVASQTVSHGNTAAQPQNPTQTNYSFRGWYTDVNLTNPYSFSTPVTNDITLYASWRRNSSGGGSTTDPTPSPSPDPDPTDPDPTDPDTTDSANPGDDNKTTDGYVIGGGSGRSDDNPYDDIVIIGEEGVPLGILELSNHIKYLNGYPDETVRPEQSITRAEVAAIFYRLLSGSGKDAETPQAFSDVIDSKWYSKEVNYLASLGIVTGYPDGTFRPDAPITRAEFATISSRFDSLILTTGTAFVDVTEDFWAVKYINSNYIRGWIDGYGDYSYKPNQSITRAEVVKIVNTMLTRLPDTLPEGINPYTDITESHWAYIHVTEASVEHSYSRNIDNVEYWTSGYTNSEG